MIIAGLVCGVVAAALVSVAGLGVLVLPAGIVGFLWGLFIGSSSGMSTRIRKGMWVHHRW
jgi:uncharacterized membrane protein YeaQ/YmgE (transglycosylase-associated protein family)